MTLRSLGQWWKTKDILTFLDLCCETAGFSREQISLSMNVFQMRGMAFIPDKLEPDIDRESDAKTYYTRVN
jgi:hypothetical protein